MWPGWGCPASFRMAGAACSSLLVLESGDQTIIPCRGGKQTLTMPQENSTIVIIIAVREVGCLERAGPPGVEGSLRETCTKQGVFDPGQGRVCVGGDPLCTWHSVFQITNAIRAPATLQLRPFPSLSRKKNGLSIFITEIAVCHSQGASVPLSLPSAGGGVAKNSGRGEPLRAAH